MNFETQRAQSESPWHRRVLVGMTAATGLFFLADAGFDFIPEDTALPPLAEVVIGAGALGIAAFGNKILRNSEISDSSHSQT